MTRKLFEQPQTAIVLCVTFDYAHGCTRLEWQEEGRLLTELVVTAEPGGLKWLLRHLGATEESHTLLHGSSIHAALRRLQKRFPVRAETIRFQRRLPDDSSSKRTRLEPLSAPTHLAWRVLQVNFSPLARIMNEADPMRCGRSNATAGEVAGAHCGDAAAARRTRRTAKTTFAAKAQQTARDGASCPAIATRAVGTRARRTDRVARADGTDGHQRRAAGRPAAVLAAGERFGVAGVESVRRFAGAALLLHRTSRDYLLGGSGHVDAHQRQRITCRRTAHRSGQQFDRDGLADRRSTHRHQLPRHRRGNESAFALLPRAPRAVITG